MKKLPCTLLAQFLFNCITFFPHTFCATYYMFSWSIFFVLGGRQIPSGNLNDVSSCEKNCTGKCLIVSWSL